MRTHGRCSQFMGTALLGGSLLGAGLLLAGPAHADASDFLNDMHRDGIHAMNGGDTALLQAGLNVCQQLSWGAAPSQLEGLALQRSDDNQGSAGLNPKQADDVVDYAARDLCPPT